MRASAKMPSSPRVQLWKKFAVSNVLALALFAAIFLAGSTARAQTIVHTDFEDGTMQGWMPRGSGTTLTNSTAQHNTGTHSLLTTG
ncbi:MAG TPA: hypothetical protein VG498_11035, partial [Terriglobales bacterium]|nr:hypothetical protein [Terriglobales bacterium]